MQDSESVACIAIVLSDATSGESVSAVGSLMMSGGWSAKSKKLKIRHVAETHQCAP